VVRLVVVACECDKWLDYAGRDVASVVFVAKEGHLLEHGNMLELVQMTWIPCRQGRGATTKYQYGAHSA
jgi:hypothetical protein